MEKIFFVGVWGSNPTEDTDNPRDDYWQGDGPMTAEEAGQLAAQWNAENPCDFTCIGVLREGVDIHVTAADLVFTGILMPTKEKDNEESDDDWRREMAMEAGMAFGCDAYNDAMGW